MNSFPFRPIGELSLNLDRRRIPVRSSDRVSGPYPYFGASGIVDYVSEFLFEGLHLLVAEDGENLRSRKTPVAFLVDGQFWVNNHAHVLQANSENDTRYLSYALEATDISGYITGSAQPKLSQASLASIKIPAPSLEIQKSISSVLGGLDDKIDSNKRAISLSESLLDALSEKSGADLPRVALSELSNSHKESVNPAKLGDALVRHYSLPAFDDGARPERTPASSIKSNKLVVPQDAILISRLNPRFNRTWWVSGSDESPAMASTEFLVLTASDELSLAGLWLALRDEHFKTELPRRVTGTSGSHQRVRPDDLLAIMVPDVRQLGKETKQRALALLRRVDQLRSEISRLTALRDQLLPELLSGRIRVPIEGATA